MPYYGLILAGGKSSRMGFDKAQLNFHGVNQVLWLNNLLGKFCEKVFVSGSPTKIDGDFNFIEDQFHRGGPLNGILSAFKHYPDIDWLIVAVDMPSVNTETLDYLFQSHQEKYFATCFKGSNNLIEPLPVILNQSAYPILFNEFNKGNESLVQFLNNNKCNIIECPNTDWLRNVNEPSQL